MRISRDVVCHLHKTQYFCGTGGGVYDKVFINPDLWTFNFYYYKRSLINSYIY